MLFFELNSQELVYKTKFPSSLNILQYELVLIPTTSNNIKEILEMSCNFENSTFGIYTNSKEVSSIKFIEKYLSSQKLILISKDGFKYCAENDFQSLLPKVFINGLIDIFSDLPSPRLSNSEGSSSTSSSLHTIIPLNSNYLFFINNDLSIGLYYLAFKNLFTQLQLTEPHENVMRVLESYSTIKYTLNYLLSNVTSTAKIINIQFFKLSRLMYKVYLESNNIPECDFKEQMEVFHNEIMKCITQGEIEPNLERFFEKLFDGRNYISLFKSIWTNLSNIKEIFEDNIVNSITSIVLYTNKLSELRFKLLNFNLDILPNTTQDKNYSFELLSTACEISKQIQISKKGFIHLFSYFSQLCKERINPKKKLEFEEAMIKSEIYYSYKDKLNSLYLLEFVEERKYYDFKSITNLLLSANQVKDNQININKNILIENRKSPLKNNQNKINNFIKEMKNYDYFQNVDYIDELSTPFESYSNRSLDQLVEISKSVINIPLKIYKLLLDDENLNLINENVCSQVSLLTTDEYPIIRSSYINDIVYLLMLFKNTNTLVSYIIQVEDRNINIINHHQHQYDISNKILEISINNSQSVSLITESKELIILNITLDLIDKYDISHLSNNLQLKPTKKGFLLFDIEKGIINLIKP